MGLPKNHPSMADWDVQDSEAVQPRLARVFHLRKMLDLLVHASVCRSRYCEYPRCLKVKGLFWHGVKCTVRASGGCHLCKKKWYLFQLHARACKDSECHVPRCRYERAIEEHSRRRAAVMEMMRQ